MAFFAEFCDLNQRITVLSKHSLHLGSTMTFAVPPFMHEDDFLVLSRHNPLKLLSSLVLVHVSQPLAACFLENTPLTSLKKK